MERTVNAPDRENLSAKEAAEWVGIPETTWEDLADRGVIPPGTRISQRTVRWHWATVLAVSLLLDHLVALGKSAPAE